MTSQRFSSIRRSDLKLGNEPAREIKPRSGSQGVGGRGKAPGVKTSYKLCSSRHFLFLLLAAMLLPAHFVAQQAPAPCPSQPDIDRATALLKQEKVDDAAKILKGAVDNDPKCPGRTFNMETCSTSGAAWATRCWNSNRP